MTVSGVLYILDTSPLLVSPNLCLYCFVFLTVFFKGHQCLILMKPTLQFFLYVNFNAYIEVYLF